MNETGEFAGDLRGGPHEGLDLSALDTRSHDERVVPGHGPSPRQHFEEHHPDGI